MRKKLLDVRASGSRKRVQLDFSPDAYRRMQHLKRGSDARTNAEVVRNALRVYDWLLTQKEKRYRIQVVTPQGDIKDVVLSY